MADQRGNRPAVGDDEHRGVLPLVEGGHELIDNRPGPTRHRHAGLALRRRPRRIVAPDGPRPRGGLVHLRGAHALPLAQVRLAQAVVQFHVHAELLPDDPRGLGCARQGGRHDLGNPLAHHQLRGVARLGVAGLGEIGIEVSLHAASRVIRGLAMADEEKTTAHDEAKTPRPRPARAAPARDRPGSRRRAATRHPRPKRRRTPACRCPPPQ